MNSWSIFPPPHVSSATISTRGCLFDDVIPYNIIKISNLLSILLLQELSPTLFIISTVYSTGPTKTVSTMRLTDWKLPSRTTNSTQAVTSLKELAIMFQLGKYRCYWFSPKLFPLPYVLATASLFLMAIHHNVFFFSVMCLNDWLLLCYSYLWLSWW